MNKKIIISLVLVSLCCLTFVSALSFSEVVNNIIIKPFGNLITGKLITSPISSPKIPSFSKELEKYLPSCTDDEGGISYYKKGTITFNNDPNLGTGIKTDSCMPMPTADSASSYYIPGFGNPAPGQLVEWYCENDLVKVEFYDCPFECIEGECTGEEPPVRGLFCLFRSKVIPVGGRIKGTGLTSDVDLSHQIGPHPITGDVSRDILTPKNWYCDYDEIEGPIMKQAKILDSSCNNNYECNSNYCKNEKCSEIITTTVTGICLGCEHNNKCLPVGFRLGNQYCPETGGTLTDQITGTCENDYECTSNLCADGNCVDIQEYENTIDLITQIFCNLDPDAPECA